MRINLRPADATDMEAIVALERAAAEAPHWPVAAYAAMLSSREPETMERCLFVAEAEAGPAGFAVGSCPAGGHGELESVVVDASSRRAGIGRALCVAVVEWCRSRDADAVELEVRAGSSGAIALYERLGFIEVGRRRGYYQNPEEDAVLMRAPLV
jgi:[ribosomal protein S18]-alanine N-acetyltransferase